MSAPRILAQVVLIGSQILGRAFIQAWRQAARNAQASAPAGVESGGRGAGDVLSRTHRMTLDEAALILNLKKGVFLEETELQRMLKNFDHLFASNNPLTKEGKPHSSHYLQSKIVRAKERIEAELFNARKATEGVAAEGGAAEGGAAGESGAAAGKGEGR